MSANEELKYVGEVTPKTVRMLASSMREATLDIDGQPHPRGYLKDIISAAEEEEGRLQYEDEEECEVEQHQHQGGISFVPKETDTYSKFGQKETNKEAMRNRISRSGTTTRGGMTNRRITSRSLKTRKSSPAIASFNQNILSSYDNTCEEVWISNYANDMHKYHSESLWAETTMRETEILVQTNTLPSNCVASMAGQMLLDFERKFGGVEGKDLTSRMVDEVLNSIFILRNENGQPSCAAARQIMERNYVIPGGEGGGGQWLEGMEGTQQKLSLLMRCPTYFDQCRYLWSMLKQEIVIRPHCFRKMEQMRKEKLMEGRMINRSCNHWARGLKYVVFNAWKKESNMDNNRHLLGKYLLAFMDIKLKDVWAAWKRYHKEHMRHKQMDNVEKAKLAAEEAKNVTKGLDMKNNGQLVSNRKARTEAEKVMSKVKGAREIYEAPARQTPILLKIIKGMERCYKLFVEFQDGENEAHIKEQFRIGDDAIRLDPVLKWTGVGINVETYEGDRAKRAMKQSRASAASIKNNAMGRLCSKANDIA